MFPSAAIAMQTRMDALLEQRRAILIGILTQLHDNIMRDISFVLANSDTQAQRGDGLPAADREALQDALERFGGLRERAERVRRAVQ